MRAGNASAVALASRNRVQLYWVIAGVAVFAVALPLVRALLADLPAGDPAAVFAKVFFGLGVVLACTSAFFGVMAIVRASIGLNWLARSGAPDPRIRRTLVIDRLVAAAYVGVGPAGLLWLASTTLWT